MNFTKHVKIREEKQGVILFDTLKEKVFVSNETGKDILALLEKQTPLEDIVTTLKERYNTPSQEIRNDVNAFINNLKENGLVEG